MFIDLNLNYFLTIKYLTMYQKPNVKPKSSNKQKNSWQNYTLSSNNVLKYIQLCTDFILQNMRLNTMKNDSPFNFSYPKELEDVNMNHENISILAASYKAIPVHQK